MNVKELREKTGLTQQELSDKTGIPRDRIAKWEQGKGTPKAADEKVLLNFFNKISWEYVPQETAVREDVIPISRDTSKSGGQDFIKRRRDLKNIHQPYMVPLVPVAAQAGYAKHFYDMAYIEKLETYPIVPGVDPHGAIWRYFQVKGKSMEDTFKEGQFLLTSQVLKEDWKNLENFYVYVVVTDEGVMIKRIAKVKGKDYWAAISDNEDEFDQFKLPIAEVKELWKYRRHIEWDASPPKKFEIKV